VRSVLPTPPRPPPTATTRLDRTPEDSIMGGGGMVGVSRSGTSSSCVGTEGRLPQEQPERCPPPSKVPTTFFKARSRRNDSVGVPTFSLLGRGIAASSSASPVRMAKGLSVQYSAFSRRSAVANLPVTGANDSLKVPVGIKWRPSFTALEIATSAKMNAQGAENPESRSRVAQPARSTKAMVRASRGR